MTYTGNVCDGCGKVFTQDDDVVVCPECATAQHRECYEKNNCCVNEHRHAEGFVWQSSVTKSAPVKEAPHEEKQEDSLPCPNCGRKNPKGSKQCAGCGMKLMVFGIDLADSIEKTKPEEPQQDTSISRYEAPFTLGTGEGFEENAAEKEETADAPAQTDEALSENASAEKEGFENALSQEAPAAEGEFAPPSAQQIQQSIIGAVENSGHDTYYDSYVENMHVNLLASLIGPKAFCYVEKFRALASGKKISFNWAAFFFTPYWFFYRKLYKAGILLMTVQMAISIAFTPAMLNYTKNFEEFANSLSGDYLAMTEEEMLLFSQQLTEQMMTMIAPMAGMMLLTFIIHLVSGFVADRLYKKEVFSAAKSVLSAKSPAESGNIIARLGGVSAIALLLAYLAEQILSSVVSALMF